MFASFQNLIPAKGYKTPWLLRTAAAAPADLDTAALLPDPPEGDPGKEKSKTRTLGP